MQETLNASNVKIKYKNHIVKLSALIGSQVLSESKAKYKKRDLKHK